MVAVLCGHLRHTGFCLGRRPCTSRRRLQGRNQCTTLTVLMSTMHGQSFLIPFITWNTKQIRKWQNKTWVEADYPDINLTTNGYNTLSRVIVYVSNDTTNPFISMTLISREIGWNSFNKTLHIVLAHILKNRLTVLNKNGGAMQYVHSMLEKKCLQNHVLNLNVSTL